MNSLAIPRFASFDTTSLTIEGNPTIDELESVGASLHLMDNCSAWWRGDVMLFAEKYHGEDAHQIVPEGDEKAWIKSRWVASRFPVSRRRANLTFSHHEIVTRLEDDQQDYWLTIAEDQHLSVSDLRKAIKGEPEEKLSCAERYEYLSDVARRVAKDMPDGQGKDDLLEALNRE